MAKSSTLQPARLSLEQVRTASPGLGRRLEELRPVDVEAFADDTEDKILDGLVRRMDDTPAETFLAETFGAGTADYYRYWLAERTSSPTAR